MRDLVHSGRNFCQVLVGAGDSELDLVADALLWTSGGGHSGDAEEQTEQQNPEGVGTRLRAHLRGTATAFVSFTLLYNRKYMLHNLYCNLKHLFLFILSIRFFYQLLFTMAASTVETLRQFYLSLQSCILCKVYSTNVFEQ